MHPTARALLEGGSKSILARESKSFYQNQTRKASVSLVPWDKTVARWLSEERLLALQFCPGGSPAPRKERWARRAWGQACL